MTCPKCENPNDEEYTGVPGVLCFMRDGRIAGRVKVCEVCKRFASKSDAAIALQKKVNTTITWLEPEEKAYGTLKAKETRRGRAIWPDGQIRAVAAGIPDTYFSIPAHGKIHGIHIHGFVSMRDGQWHFTPDKKYAYLCGKEDT